MGEGSGRALVGRGLSVPSVECTFRACHPSPACSAHGAHRTRRTPAQSMWHAPVRQPSAYSEHLRFPVSSAVQVALLCGRLVRLCARSHADVRPECASLLGLVRPHPVAPRPAHPRPAPPHATPPSSLQRLWGGGRAGRRHRLKRGRAVARRCHACIAAPTPASVYFRFGAFRLRLAYSVRHFARVTRCGRLLS